MKFKKKEIVGSKKKLPENIEKKFLEILKIKYLLNSMLSWYFTLFNLQVTTTITTSKYSKHQVIK